jgi:hypothetical protein
MRRSTILTIVLTTSLTSLGLVWLLNLSISKSFAEKKGETSLQIPDKLKVPGNQPLILKAIAKGNQIYTCKAKAGDPNTFEWTLKAPEAQLFDEQGQSLGSHYAGPTWESTDRSKVMGKIKTKINAPQPDKIPWLLLAAKSHEGTGIFTQVNWVQRVNTMGGQAPKTGCDRIHHNQELSVAYTADYYFYGKKATSGAPN